MNAIFLEANQYTLVKNNGLPVLIQALTESQDEELHKAAIFVLQNCKPTSKNMIIMIDFLKYISRTGF